MADNVQLLQCKPFTCQNREFKNKKSSNKRIWVKLKSKARFKGTDGLHSIRAVDSKNYFQLSYLDPSTKQTRICTTNCTLSNDTSIDFQDYRILNTNLTSGIAIDIMSWYGSSGGLSSVSVFQSGIFIFIFIIPVFVHNTFSFCIENFIYAVDTLSTNSPCSNNSSTVSRVKTVGNWTQVSDGGISYLSTTASNASSITFYPTIAESGIYEVYLYAPECSRDCDNVVDFDIQLATSARQNPTTVFLSSNSTATSGLLIYTGYFDLSSDFQPTIQISQAHNSTKTGSIVAHSFQFVKEASNNALASIIQYDTSSQTISADSLPWKALSGTKKKDLCFLSFYKTCSLENVPYKSIVHDIKPYGDALYIAGSFTGTDQSKSTYSNIVRYDATTKQLKALANGGTNGGIESLAVSTQSGEIFVAGNFSALVNGTNTRISHVARYNVQQAAWNALDEVKP
jgi:hypothetical protein